MCTSQPKAPEPPAPPPPPPPTATDLEEDDDARRRRREGARRGTGQLRVPLQPINTGAAVRR